MAHKTIGREAFRARAFVNAGGASTLIGFLDAKYEAIVRASACESLAKLVDLYPSPDVRLALSAALPSLTQLIIDGTVDAVVIVDELLAYDAAFKLRIVAQGGLVAAIAALATSSSLHHADAGPVMRILAALAPHSRPRGIIIAAGAANQAILMAGRVPSALEAAKALLADATGRDLVAGSGGIDAATTLLRAADGDSERTAVALDVLRCFCTHPVMPGIRAKLEAGVIPLVVPLMRSSINAVILTSYIAYDTSSHVELTRRGAIRELGGVLASDGPGSAVARSVLQFMAGYPEQPAYVRDAARLHGAARPHSPANNSSGQ